MFESIYSRAKSNGLNDLRSEINKSLISNIEPNIKGKYFLRSPSSANIHIHHFDAKNA